MESLLVACIRRHMSGLGQVGREDTLLDLGYDSFKFIELVLIVEREFSIEFADDALSFRRFSRVADLLAYIEECAAGRRLEGGA